jgi:hypothetical protein
MVKQADSYVIKLYDRSGILIEQIDEGTADPNVVKNVKIDCTSLPAGLYMVIIQTNNYGSKTFKLVKQ